ncbi:uncharacterized protein LOC110113461 isoform X1 [Dendrobium catenatum]|uniref:Uncharacterized protein n=1 Tax=Dendrobium catenatum TaxID=906689 RepID=A0A2I0W8G4_9ASPA|nr:uncharacterized protein LOC110113461 isoform X1 [Dendrobium catenatum]PKU71943.1 hypothetical protein MA16_Dca013824 [Dendrobium catenatum]
MKSLSLDRDKEKQIRRSERKSAMQRADRSDSHLPPEEEARREEDAREYFDGIAPKRHTKPSRSEYSTVYSDDLLSSGRDSIPELDKLRNLEANQEKLVCDGSEVEEEYVETEYYKDLNCVDKQHHTTGTGFIKMDKSNRSSFNLTPDSTTSLDHVSGHGNPATNEWIPSADVVLPVSHKPKRSDL